MKKTIIAGLLAAAANFANAGTVLVVVSDLDKLDLKDGKTMQTGFFINELMEPVQAFIAAGHTVVFATPSGKAPSADQKSDDVNFWGGNEKARQESKALLATLKLTEEANSITRSMAYGKQRLVEIALALATKPKVLLLDEPAAGVPRDESQELFEVVSSLSRDISVLFIEHDMNFVFRFASRIIVMVGGRILLEGTPDEIAADPKVREVYLGARKHG